MTGSEYSTGSTFDATSPIYNNGSNICSNDVNMDEHYVPELVSRHENEA